MDNLSPKIFISYSWDATETVLELATRLMSDGVSVLLDKWELKEGQDKFVFMEKCVNDPDIDKVILVSNKLYSKKSNNREGGVGDETMVISSEIYSKATQTKFIPIVIERDDLNKPYLPSYLKSLIYIDLCPYNNDYEKNYESLVRNIYGKPEFQKPALGTPPDWLNDEISELSSVRVQLRKFKSINPTNINQLLYVSHEFKLAFVNSVITYMPNPLPETNIEKFFISQINNVKYLRDLYFDYIEAIIQTEFDFSSAIADFFETLFNETYKNKLTSDNNSTINAFNRFLIWEMFIGTIVILLNFEKFSEIRNLLMRTYFLCHLSSDCSSRAHLFNEFRPSLEFIENNIKSKLDPPRPVILAGQMLINREKFPLITKESLVCADLFLYHFSILNLNKLECWIPLLRIYTTNSILSKMIWNKMVSRNYCTKLYSLFNVNNISDLKDFIKQNANNTSMFFKYSDTPVQIVSLIDIDKIASSL
jgi:hypothetical protein